MRYFVRPYLHGIYHRRLMKGKMLWIDNLRLEEAMRNLICGNQKFCYITEEGQNEVISY